MDTLYEIGDRRTSADIVFDALYDQIVSLDLLPGAKMSEVEVAKRFGLSRQPVRDAFNRLSNLELLLVRPQRSTIVRHFSLAGIQNARFIRTAIEVEVLRRACEDRDTAFDADMRENLAQQTVVIEANDADGFHRLDYEFHRLLCQSARAEFAFETIAANKAQVDRLCMLSLTSKDAMQSLYSDHTEILDGLQNGNTSDVETVIRRHLGRLSPTIDKIHVTHSEYFED